MLLELPELIWTVSKQIAQVTERPETIKGEARQNGLGSLREWLTDLSTGRSASRLKQGDRIDISWRRIREAKDLGIGISTDLRNFTTVLGTERLRYSWSVRARRRSLGICLKNENYFS